MEGAFNPSGPMFLEGSSAIDNEENPFVYELSALNITSMAKKITTVTIQLSLIGDVGLEVSAWAVSACGRLDNTTEAVFVYIIMAERFNSGAGIEYNTVPDLVFNCLMFSNESVILHFS